MPTVASVIPGYVAETWFGLVGPAGMPADVVDRLNAAVNKAMSSPEVQQRFTSFGVVPKTASSQKLGEMTADDVARWAPVIRENRITTD